MNSFSSTEGTLVTRTVRQMGEILRVTPGAIITRHPDQAHYYPPDQAHYYPRPRHSSIGIRFGKGSVNTEILMIQNPRL